MIMYVFATQINIIYCCIFIFSHSCQPIFGAYLSLVPYIYCLGWKAPSTFLSRVYPYCLGYCCILLSRISFLQRIAKVWLTQLEMKKNFVFLQQFERYPGRLATKAAAVAKLADLANKIFSSEVVMNSEVQVLGVLEHMPASMELEGDMEQLPTFRSCPVVQILVCIKEPFGKVHSSAVFMGCQKSTNAVKVLDELVESMKAITHGDVNWCFLPLQHFFENLLQGFQNMFCFRSLCLKAWKARVGC